MRRLLALTAIALATSPLRAPAEAPPAQQQASTSETDQGPFTRAKIVEVMRKVHAYQAAHPYTPSDQNWIRATYYTGVMALYHTTKDPAILDQAVRWAEKHHWAEGTEPEPANRKTCGQTYLELYFIKPDPRRITMLGKATGESKYYDYLNRVYWDVTEHLFDKQYGLFYRDRRFVDAKTENGKKVFWARGNGWVLGGIPRILTYLPKDNERYDDYVKLLQTMSAAIAPRQGADGLWRSNLDDPDQCPNPETSSSAFFCYAMAWGINEGLLDRNTYLPVVTKAWKGLVHHVQPNGKLGFVQPVGASPKPATREMTHEYAMGLFLLSGSEMIRLVESGGIR